MFVSLSRFSIQLTLKGIFFLPIKNTSIINEFYEKKECGLFKSITYMFEFNPLLLILWKVLHLKKHLFLTSILLLHLLWV